MADRAIARLFQNGRSQAVRLPRAFRFPGDRVRIRRVNRAVVLEPITENLNEWFMEMDSLGTASLLPERREQPTAPPRGADLL